MSAIIQTLTVAVTLLIVGLTCMLIGVAGLMWKIEYDRRRADKAAKAANEDNAANEAKELTTSEFSSHELASPTAVHQR